MGGFFDPGGSQQTQESGFTPGQRGVAGNRINYFSNFLDPYARSIFGGGDSLGLDSDKVGFDTTGGGEHREFNPFGSGTIYDQKQYKLPELSAMGLFAPQQNAYDSAFSQAVNQVFGKTSGAYAANGFNNPNAIGAIAGDVSKQVAPQMLAQLLPMAGQNITNSLTLPHQLANADFATALQYLQALSGGGQGGTGSQQQTGSGLGYEMAKKITPTFSFGMTKEV